MVSESELFPASALTHQPIKGGLWDKQLRALLVAPDFAKRDRSRAETMRSLLLCFPRRRLWFWVRAPNHILFLCGGVVWWGSEHWIAVSLAPWVALNLGRASTGLGASHASRCEHCSSGPHRPHTSPNDNDNRRCTPPSQHRLCGEACRPLRTLQRLRRCQ